MSAPLVPSPLDCVGHRRFALYPAIRNIEPNDWMLGSSSWSEIQVINSRSGDPVWVPRPYIGGVSDRYDSILVVELTKELEFKCGGLEPCVKRVIEMPQGASVWVEKPFDKPARRPPGPAPVVAIRSEHPEDSLIGKPLVRLGAGALALYLIVELLSSLARAS